MNAIRCWCSSCAGTTYMRLSDWLHAHPDYVEGTTLPFEVSLELDATVARHPSARP